MRFTSSFISRLSFSLPLETIIMKEGVKLLPKGSNLITTCPFHRERTPSFMVIRQKQIYRCFGCGVSGNIFSFIGRYKHISFLDSVIYLCKKYDIEYPKNKQKKKRRSIK